MAEPDTSDSTRVTISDLADGLAGAGLELVSNTILARLIRLDDEIEYYKKLGPSPSDYSQAEVIGRAIAAARDVVLAALSVGDRSAR